MQDAAVLLGRDMAITLDCELRDTAFAGGAGTATLYGRKAGEAKISARNKIVVGANELVCSYY